MVPAAGSLIKKTILSTARLRESEGFLQSDKHRHGGAVQASARETGQGTRETVKELFL